MSRRTLIDKLRFAALMGPIELARVGTTEEGGPIYEIVRPYQDYLDSPTVQTIRIGVELISRTLEEVRELATGLSEVGGVATVLMNRQTDTTHLSVAEAARFAGVSVKTIRNRVSKGILTLETIFGTKRFGIPVEQPAAGWVSEAQAGRLRGRHR